MNQGDKEVWIAWMIQKAECHRTGKPFPAASSEITTDAVDAMLKDWGDRSGKKR